MKTTLPISKSNFLKPPVPGVMKTITRVTLLAVVTVTILFLTTTVSLGQFPFNLDGGAGKTVICRGVVRDASNNVYVTGSFAGTVNFNPSGTANLTSAGGNDIFVAKYDASGAYQWAFKIGGTGSDIGYSIALDASNNVYVTGTFAKTNVNFNPAGSALLSSQGAADIFVASYTSAGAYLWAFDIGSDLTDIAYSIAVDATGNVVITGRFGDTMDFDPLGNPHTPSSMLTLSPTSNNDCFVASYTSSGAYMWAFDIGAPSGNGSIGLSIATDAFNNVLVTGFFQGTVNFNPNGTALLTSPGATEADEDYFVAKYDVSGNYLWAFNLDNTTSGAGILFQGITVDASNNVLITGGFIGTDNFQGTSGTSHLVSSVGTSNSIYIAKYNSSGAYQWSHALGSAAGTSLGGALTTDAAGNAYVTGFFGGTVNFNPSGTANINSIGSQDAFVASYNSSGAYRWAFGTGNFNDGTLGDGGSAIALDACTNLLVAGNFSGGATSFNTTGGAPVILTPTTGSTDGFIAKYYSASGVPAIEEPASAAVCPSGNAVFTVTASNATGYQWQENQGSGFVNLSNGGVYSGVLTSTLTITTPAGTMSGYTYLCIVTTSCDPIPIPTNGAATLTFAAAPAITVQPANSTAVCAGTSASVFTVTATGGGLTYQWQQSTNAGVSWANTTDGGLYSGSTTASLTISTPLATMNGYQYRVVIGSACGLGTLTSNGSATQTVYGTPVVTASPSPTSICVGSAYSTTFSVSVTATGSPALTYAWQQTTTPISPTFANLNSGASISGQNTATLTVHNLASTARNGDLYRMYVSDVCGNTLSATAMITVNASPAITGQPSSAIVCVPGSGAASFTVSATGGSLTYQWQENQGSGFVNLSNGGVYSGVLTATLTITNPAAAMNGYTYQCVVSNPCTPSATSNGTATLSVGASSGTAIAAGGTSSTPNAVICNGTSTTITLTNYTGTIQWQSSADGETNWQEVVGGSGDGTATYTTAALITTTYYRALTTSSCFTIASNTVVVSVQAASPALTVTLTNQTSTSIVASWTPNAANSNDVFNVAWTGGDSASGVNSPYVIASGITPGDAYTVTVSEVTAGCNANSTATINALCAAPTLSLSSAANKGFTATWNNTGATTYRLYFKQSTYPNYSFVDVSGTTYTFTSLYSDAEYLCYVAAENCPVPGQFGVPSVEQYINTLPGSSACAIPVVGATSSCANQITITLSGSPTNNYFVIFGRISPNPSASVGYNITGIAGTTTVNINVGIQNAASTWQVYAESNCGSGLTLPCTPVYVTIKPTCNQLQNLVLSTPNCDGFVGTWNADNCSGSLVSYYLYVKKSTAVGYNAYPVGTNNYIDATWLGPNTYDAYVASASCNKAISQASTVQTIVTGVGCGRAEEEAADNNTTTTEDNNQKVVMNVYPNPTSGNFMVNIYTKGSNDENIKIEIFNTLGQVVLTLITPVTNGISNNAFQMPEGLASGIYFIHTVVNGENLSQQVMFTK